MHYPCIVFGTVDWSECGAYMRARHGISPAVADDALADPNCVVIDPGYASVTGRTVRVIGYSLLARAVVSVKVLIDGEVTQGVNGWPANDKDRRIYREGDGNGQDQ